MLLTGMAGGMGWGIRGQYGHETGAMIAGALVGLVLVFLFCPRLHSLSAARAVALMALGVSFGGSMTYGQTVGLTHDAPLIGNTGALGWGLLGLFLKGGIWIGFAGLLLGTGLSQKRYSAWELTGLLCLAVLLLLGGIHLLNRPFDPANRELPRIYFSDHWRWEPNGDLKPRPEKWGGLLFALAGLFVYVTLVKRDALARQLTLWGFFGGGLGFATGQSFQAAHAWHPEWFEYGLLNNHFVVHLNWWNLMETTFGFLFGAILALGVWRNRHRLAGHHNDAPPPTPKATMSPWIEGVLLAVHLTALVTWNFSSVDQLDRLADLAIPMGILPMLGIMAGRWWPYLFALPVVALPIAGKTIRELAYKNEVIPEVAGFCVYGVMPLFIIASVAVYFAKNPHEIGVRFTRWSLVLMTWMYFYLNWAFFRYPWPWEGWTNRTPHGLIFLFCALCLTAVALLKHRHVGRPPLDATVAPGNEPKPEPVVPWAK